MHGEYENTQLEKSQKSQGQDFCRFLLLCIEAEIAPTRDKQKYRIYCGIFIYFGGTVDSNDKILLLGSNVSLGLSQNVINLRVSSYLCELRSACSYILGFPWFCAKNTKPAGARIYGICQTFNQITI